MNTPYALFDPNSAYNVLRATLLPHEKIRGYFYWRQTRRARGEEKPGPSPDRPPLVFRGGAPPVRLQADVTIPRTEPLPGRYTIEVMLREQADIPAGAACRAFLVEQGVLDRLRARPSPAVVCREGERLTLRDLSTWEVRAAVSLSAGVLSAAVLDDRRVAVLTSLGAVQLWDTTSGAVDTSAEPEGGRTLWGLTVSADRHIAWGNEAGEVFTLDPATGTKRLVQQHPAAVTALTALPDGRLASGHRDGVVCVDGSKWADRSGDPIGAVVAVARGRVAYNVSGGAVRLWTPGAERAEPSPIVATGLAGLPDGRLVSAGPAGLTLWDLERVGWQVLSDGPARAVLAAPGPRLIKVAEDDSVWAWNLQTGQDRLLQPGGGATGWVEPLAGGALLPSLAGEDELALGQILDHRLLSEEFSVQQRLSALPELEGRLVGDRIVLEANIPAASPNISDRAWVVVVLDAPPG